jgi:arylsulfatase A-like enzyme
VEVPAAAPPTPERALNVVLITLDTVRADALNPDGQTRVSSPVMDRMAREGVLFEQVASSSPSTLPSHTTILTGRFPPAHGVRSNSGYVIAAENETVAEVLKRHGYRTGAEIGVSVLDANTGLDQGFDHYRDLTSPGVEKIRAGALAEDGEKLTLALEERPAADITRFGKTFLDGNRTRPFFLWLHYFDPHRVYIPRPEFQRRRDARLPGLRVHDPGAPALLGSE